jgi:Fe-S-cluster containining protein
MDRRKIRLGTTSCEECTAACCKRVDIATKEVHRCIHLGKDDSCTIYETRPLACNFDVRWTTPELLKAHCLVSQLSEWNNLTINEAIKLASSEG